MSGWKLPPADPEESPGEHFIRGKEIVFEGETFEEVFEKMRAAGLLGPEPEGNA